MQTISNRIILHCDLNNFFASVECIENPKLQGKPVAVSGNPKKRTGVILAKNEKAKSFGIKTGDVIWEAMQKCPKLICVESNYKKYLEYSEKVFEIYKRYTDKIESFGIDECWLDVSNSQKIFGNGQEIANKIREDIKKELGLTASVGVSFCKLFAKIGSDLKKPDATTVISKENFKSIIYPLEIDSVIGIGRKTSKKLKKMNINFLGEFVQVDDKILKNLFGIPLVELKQKLLGFDNEEVSTIYSQNRIKSIGNGTTTVIDIEKEDDIKTVINLLCEEIARRLRKKNFTTSAVSIHIKTNEFKTEGKQAKIGFETDSSQTISDEVFKLLKTFWDFSKLVRSIRVCCFSLKDKTEQTQISIFSLAEDKKSKLGEGVDKIRKKHGASKIHRADSKDANFINNRFEISTEVFELTEE